MSKKEFYNLPNGSTRRSADGKMILKKHPLYIEVLCLTLAKPNRYLRVYYNMKYLGKIFGSAENGYDNTIDGSPVGELSTAGGHWHENIDELMRSFSLTGAFTIKLKDPKTGNTQKISLSGKPIRRNGKFYVKTIIVPAGIAHLVENRSHETMTLAVITSGQHEDSDIYPCEM